MQVGIFGSGLAESSPSYLKQILDDFGITMGREQMIHEKKWFSERNYNICDIAISVC